MKLVSRDPRSGKFIVGRESMGKLNAMEGLNQSPGSRAMFEEFDRRGASSEERRKFIKERHAKQR